MRKFHLHQRHTGDIETVERDKIYISGPLIVFSNGGENQEGTNVLIVSEQDYHRIEEEVSHSEEVSLSGWGKEQVITNEDDVPLPGMDLTYEDQTNMAEYHLDDLRDEDSNELLGFICTGIDGMNGPCGIVYRSIQDRMLHDPEICSGCFVRMAQG